VNKNEKNSQRRIQENVAYTSKKGTVFCVSKNQQQQKNYAQNDCSFFWTHFFVSMMLEPELEY
jgi:hypothetical protein